MNIRVIEESKATVAQELAQKLSADAAPKAKVALLLSGGSALAIYDYLVPFVESRKMGSLVLALVDERFSLDKNYPDSNFVQIDTKTNLFKRARELYHDIIPVLEGKSFAETSELYNRRLTNLWGNGYKKIAVLGIGEDGHTAGILPRADKKTFESTFLTERLAVGYENDGSFKHRITLTPKALGEMESAYVFALGAAKRGVLTKMAGEIEPLHLFPAGLIKTMTNVTVFTDQHS